VPQNAFRFFEKYSYSNWNSSASVPLQSNEVCGAGQFSKLRCGRCEYCYFVELFFQKLVLTLFLVVTRENVRQ
jgi:hypothetical protein